jgi:hypothetical protein
MTTTAVNMMCKQPGDRLSLCVRHEKAKRKLLLDEELLLVENCLPMSRACQGHTDDQCTSCRHNTSHHSCAVMHSTWVATLACKHTTLKLKNVSMKE